MNDRDMKCLRCHADMVYVRTEKFQLGETGWFFGDLSNLLAGSMELSLYSCPQCGKVEFFQALDEETDDDDGTEDRIAQTTCPFCGKQFDMDYPRCPFCKHEKNG